MRELVRGKNTIGRTAAVLKSPTKRTLPLTLNDIFTIKITQYFMQICSPLTAIRPRVASEQQRSKRVALCRKKFGDP